MKHCLKIILCVCLASGAIYPDARSQEFSDTDSLSHTAITEIDSDERNATLYADSIGFLRKTPRWMRQYINSLIKGNVDRTHEKAIDIGFGMAPSYTYEASVGIGAMCTGLYRTNRSDSTLIPSDVFASFNASVNGFFVLMIKGNNLFSDHKSRLSYKMELYRKRLNFWGIDAESTSRNPKSAYDRRQIDLKVQYVYRLSNSLYIGAQARFDYTDARRMKNPEYLLGERPQYYVTGLGLLVELDTRNSILTPTRGYYLAYQPMVYPKFMGNAPSFFNSHTLIGNIYVGLSRRTTLAFDLYANINSARAPWTMREMIASDGIRMRGYYMGSYLDNSQISLQMELRQNIYRRLGGVVWLGGASVFSSLKDFKSKDSRPQWLPNWGIGARFEFKHNVNIRVDYGFGRHTSGLLFSIGEAF